MTERRFYAMPYPSGWRVMDRQTGERADEREFPGSIEANQWAGVLAQRARVAEAAPFVRQGGSTARNPNIQRRRIN